MWPANLVWVPRVTAAEIAAGTGQDVRLWAVADVKSMIDTWAATGFANPMTTIGDIIYASASGTPATAARLAVGADFAVLSATPTVPGYKKIQYLDTAGWFGGVQSIALYRFSNGANTYAATCTDATSNALIALGQFVFQQDTSAVANNTTSVFMSSASGPDFASKLLFSAFFATPTTADSFIVISYAIAGAASATATELNNSMGVSFLSGDTAWMSFTRGGAGSTRAALTGGTNAGLQANKLYFLTIDCINFPTCVISLYNVTDAVWVGSATITSTLSVTTGGGTPQFSFQTSTAAVRSVYWGGSAMIPQGVPNRSAP